MTTDDILTPKERLVKLRMQLESEYLMLEDLLPPLRKFIQELLEIEKKH